MKLITNSLLSLVALLMLLLGSSALIALFENPGALWEKSLAALFVAWAVANLRNIKFV